jgi:hypothetical protein
MTELASPLLSFAICLFGSALVMYARAKSKATPAAGSKPSP